MIKNQNPFSGYFKNDERFDFKEEKTKIIGGPEEASKGQFKATMQEIEKELAKPIPKYPKKPKVQVIDEIKGQWLIDADGKFNLWWDLANVLIIVSF